MERNTGESSSRLELLSDSESDTSFLTTSSTSFSQRAPQSPAVPTAPSPPPAGGIQLLRATRRSGDGHRYPFARDVTISGWKVVGGDKWQDAAKVGAYVVYDVGIITCDGAPITILRRYREFEQFRHDLKAAYPHLRKTIPKLPGKLHVSKFSTKFLEDRLPRLQRFLKTVLLHPEMGAGVVASDWVVGSRRESG